MNTSQIMNKNDVKQSDDIRDQFHFGPDSSKYNAVGPMQSQCDALYVYFLNETIQNQKNEFYFLNSYTVEAVMMIIKKKYHL